MDTVHECDRRTDGQMDRQSYLTDTVQTASHGKNQLRRLRRGLLKDIVQWTGLLTVETIRANNTEMNGEGRTVQCSVYMLPSMSSKDGVTLKERSQVK